MRKRFFMFVLAFLLAIPGTILLTACGEDAGNSKELVGLAVKIDGDENNNLWCDYGKTLEELYENTSFMFVYSDGSKKDVVEKNFSAKEWEEINNSYKEKYYVDNQGEFEDFDVKNLSQVLDVGHYKVDISLKNKTCSIYINVLEAKITSKEVSVVI